MRQERRRVSSAVRVVLGCIVLAGCGRDGAKAPASKAPAAQPATAAVAPAPAPAAPKPAASAAVAPAAVGARHAATAEPKAIKAAPKVDPYSVFDVEIAAPKPLVLKVRVQTDLAPELAAGKLKLEQPTFTVAGRPIDVSGGQLSVCGIGLGPIEDRSVLTLRRGEVRVDDIYRGPLPAPPSAPVGTH